MTISRRSFVLLSLCASAERLLGQESGIASRGIAAQPKPAEQSPRTDAPKVDYQKKEFTKPDHTRTQYPPKPFKKKEEPAKPVDDDMLQQLALKFKKG